MARRKGVKNSARKTCPPATQLPALQQTPLDETKDAGSSAVESRGKAAQLSGAAHSKQSESQYSATIETATETPTADPELSSGRLPYEILQQVCAHCAYDDCDLRFLSRLPPSRRRAAFPVLQALALTSRTTLNIAQDLMKHIFVIKSVKQGQQLHNELNEYRIDLDFGTNDCDFPPLAQRVLVFDMPRKKDSLSLSNSPRTVVDHVLEYAFGVEHLAILGDYDFEPEVLASPGLSDLKTLDLTARTWSSHDRSVLVPELRNNPTLARLMLHRGCYLPATLSFSGSTLSRLKLDIEWDTQLTAPGHLAALLDCGSHTLALHIRHKAYYDLLQPPSLERYKFSSATGSSGLRRLVLTGSTDGSEGTMAFDLDQWLKSCCDSLESLTTSFLGRGLRLVIGSLSGGLSDDDEPSDQFKPTVTRLRHLRVQFTMHEHYIGDVPNDAFDLDDASDRLQELIHLIKYSKSHRLYQALSELEVLEVDWRRDAGSTDLSSVLSEACATKGIRFAWRYFSPELPKMRRIDEMRFDRHLNAYNYVR